MIVIWVIIPHQNPVFSHINPFSLLWTYCKENKNVKLSLTSHTVSCSRKFMSWVEQLLKTITTQPNSDNMKYSFKIGIAFLYVTYARFKASNLASLMYSGDTQLRKIQFPSTILFQTLPKVKERQTMHHGIPSKFPNTSPWIHCYILVTVRNKMSLFATWHTKISPDSNVIPVNNFSVQYIQLPTLLRDDHSKETENLILTPLITLQQ